MKGPQKYLKIGLLRDSVMFPDRECNGGEYEQSGMMYMYKEVLMKYYLNCLITEIKFLKL